MPRRAERAPVAGIYAIAPELADTGWLVQIVEAALAGGAAMVQYRNKGGTPGLRDAQAVALAAACRRAQARLIVNDDVELAQRCGADGVHLGRDDGSIAGARLRLGPGRLVGASCYGSVAHAVKAVADGADHVAFGSLFPSTTKPHAPAAPLSLFRDARAAGLTVPLVGIGGIDAGNIHELFIAGADCAALVGGIFGDNADLARIQQRTRALVQRFQDTKTTSHVD